MDEPLFRKKSMDRISSPEAQVENGSMVIRFDNEKIAQNVKTGMTIVAGETESRISTIGKDAFGSTFATASTTLSDGTYSVKVLFRQTQVINLLFN